MRYYFNINNICKHFGKRNYEENVWEKFKLLHIWKGKFEANNAMLNVYNFFLNWNFIRKFIIKIVEIFYFSTENSSQIGYKLITKNIPVTISLSIHLPLIEPSMTTIFHV